MRHRKCKLLTWMSGWITSTQHWPSHCCVCGRTEGFCLTWKKDMMDTCEKKRLDESSEVMSWWNVYSWTPRHCSFSWCIQQYCILANCWLSVCLLHATYWSNHTASWAFLPLTSKLSVPFPKRVSIFPIDNWFSTLSSFSDLEKKHILQLKQKL